MKKFALTIILIFSLSFFCACNRQDQVSIGDDFIMLSLEQTSNGGMVQSIRFSLNSKRLNSLSSSLQEELTFRKNLIKEVEIIRNEFLFTYAIKYVKNPVDEYKINKGVILTDVVYQEKGDYVGFDIYFTSSGAWNYYNSSDTIDNENSNKPTNNDGNLFFKRTKNKGAFPFSAIVKTENETKLAGEIYKERFLSSAKGLSFEQKLREEYNCQYIYNYATFYKKLKSDSQLQYYGNDKKYHHVWVVDEEKLTEESSMTLSITQLNRGWWIFFALTIPLAIAMNCIIIIKIKEKKTREIKKEKID